MTRWQPPFLVTSGAALSVAAVGALAAHPPAWPVVLGALALPHALFSIASCMPRSTLLGPNISRLGNEAAKRGLVSLTFDDGPDPKVTPRVLDLLDAADARASFFCVGRHVRAHPELAREILARGHSIENHTDRHPYGFGFYFYGPCKRELEAGQASITNVTGVPPRYVRAPAGVRNLFVDPAAHALGLKYVSWTHRGLDTVDEDIVRVAARLIAPLAAGDILLLHDGDTMRGKVRRAPLIEVLPRVLDGLSKKNLRSVRLADALA